MAYSQSFGRGFLCELLTTTLTSPPENWNPQLKKIATRPARTTSVWGGMPACFFWNRVYIGEAEPEYFKTMSIDSNTVVRVMFSDRTTLLAFIWTLVRDVHAAEDIFQDVVMEAMSKASQIDDTEHLRAWIRQAARFRAVDHMRRKSPAARRLDDDVIELLDARFAEMQRSDSSDMLDALSHCLGHLAPRGRQLIEMRYGQSMTGKQVAEQLGQTAHSVYVAMNRIYTRLAECIRRRLDSTSVGRTNHP